ncbi:hypothetical protein AO385_2163 [Moraxella catarrhalis]|uniref:Uncharacterized protein n=1 Tax=Moraxella catarrhalis TaxID=480 RepID=A0A198UUT9_MORCA|nr:hypothetical protein AO385_2163 [Moraxella catarrhalis]OAU96986.1 hypothetical protein AO384_0795 [Moraxella catarrhalis]OAV00071.1 hypothetical protein AO382_1668 [Moraxella catarrhalis]
MILLSYQSISITTHFKSIPELLQVLNTKFCRKIAKILWFNTQT